MCVCACVCVCVCNEWKSISLPLSCYLFCSHTEAPCLSVSLTHTHTHTHTHYSLLVCDGSWQSEQIKGTKLYFCVHIKHLQGQNQTEMIPSGRAENFVFRLRLRSTELPVWETLSHPSRTLYVLSNQCVSSPELKSWLAAGCGAPRVFSPVPLFLYGSVTPEWGFWQSTACLPPHLMNCYFQLRQLRSGTDCLFTSSHKLPELTLITAKWEELCRAFSRSPWWSWHFNGIFNLIPMYQQNTRYHF